jgi:cell wall assembly regulator SMI1
VTIQLLTNDSDSQRLVKANQQVYIVDMTRPRATFAQLLEALALVHQPSVDRLAPPATPAQIVTLENWLGVSVPSEAREVYSLHNGQFRDAGIGGIFDRTLLTISQALVDLNAHDDIRRSGIFDDITVDDEMGGGERVSENFPSAGHVPILSDMTGNFIGYDVRPSARGRFGQVLVFGADVGTTVMFDSLHELWGTLLNELRVGNWKLVEDEFTGLITVQFRTLGGTLKKLWA